MALNGGISKTKYNVSNSAETRVDALWDNVLDSKVRLGEPDVTQILSLIETAQSETEYKYSVQTSIAGKSALTRGADDVRRLNLPINLHHKFCRPDVIIRELKLKAASNEPFSYYQQKTYLGEFVIARIKEDIINKIDGITTFAQIEVELLECPPQTPDDFEQQSKKAAINPKEVPETPPKITKPKDLLTASKEDIWDTLSDAVLDKGLRKAESYINGTIGGIIPGVL